MSIAASPADEHLLLAFEGLTPPDRVVTMLRERPPAGFTLFRPTNVDTPGQVRELTDTLQRLVGGDPLIIGVDQEGGQLMSAGAETTPFAGNMALGAADDVDLTRRVGTAIGTELKAMGLNLNYAPVADVATNPHNPAVGTRSFGDDPIRVAGHVAAMVEGVRSMGVATTVKHFPGGGETTADPHHELPVLDVDLAHLESIELPPFRAAIAAGTDAVMIGHSAVPALTGARRVAGTFAPELIAGLLRPVFDRVVISDALDMGAVDPGPDGTVDVVAALNAGVDLLLCMFDEGQNRRIRRSIEQAVVDGTLSPDLLAAAAGRVAGLRRGITHLRPDLDRVGCQDHRRLAAELARRSVTLVKDQARLLPLGRDGSRRLLSIMPAPTDLTPADSSSLEPPGLAAALRRHHRYVTEVVVSPAPTRNQISGVVELARRHDQVVAGTIDAGVEQSALIGEILAIGVPTITVSLRSPADLTGYPHTGTHLCSYSITRSSLDAVADVVFGRSAAEGRLPMAIPGLFRRGHGGGDVHRTDSKQGAER